MKNKKYKIKLPECKWCDAIGKHYSWQCKENPKNKCKHCGGSSHTSLMCQKKPRKRLKPEAEKTKYKRTETTREWYRLNPPDEKGLWYCYLQISPKCPFKLTRSTITLEHVRPKVRAPELKYETSNLKPSCMFCNSKKQSLDIEDLVAKHPHLKVYLNN